MLRPNQPLIVLALAAFLLGACSPTGQAPVSITVAPATPLPAAVLVPTPPRSAVSAATPIAAGATVTAESERATLKSADFTSQALAGNLLGDPTTRKLRVLLPPGYATSDRRYPVLYVLHYYTGDSQTHVYEYLEASEQGRKLDGVRDMIIVFPDGSNKLGGSWYLDSPTTGNYETYIVREIVDYADSQFRTIPQSDSRGITGCSMGADGAAHLAFNHPDVFSAVASVSGAYDWGPNFILEDAKLFTHAPKDVADFDSLPFYQQVVISRAAAAAPNPAKPPLYLDMPFELVNGKPQPVSAVWDKLDAVDPIHDAMRYAKKTPRLAGIMIYHGDRDDMVPVETARRYDQLLTDLGIEHDYVEVKNRGHCELDYRQVLKFMSDHLNFAAP